MPFLSSDDLLPTSLNVADKLRAVNTLAQIKIAIAPSLADEWQTCFAQLAWPCKTALVCDNQTWKALGQQLGHNLQQAGYEVTLINLGSTPNATETLARYIMDASANCETLIAAGSGTINDLTKIAAHRSGKPYAVCGTAPSMNGYLSANAAIMVDGHKQSLPATLPVAALFDLSVVEAAPQRLIQSGIGDSLCRPTAQADWLLSHLLLDTPYDALPYALLEPYEAAMQQGNMRALIITLLLSGLGMTLAGGSYPASQGEHLIAHYMEMQHPDVAHATYHGEQIGVTTLYMAQLQHDFLALKEAPQWREAPYTEEKCSHIFSGAALRHVYSEYTVKIQRLGGREAFNRKLQTRWPEIRDTLHTILLPRKNLAAALQRLQAPQLPADLGWDNSCFADATRYAHLIRNRFTFLDIAALTG